MKNLIVFISLLLAAKQMMAQGAIEYLNDGIYKTEIGGKVQWGLYNPDSKNRDTLTSALFDTIYYRFWHGSNVEYYKLRIADKWGLWDKKRRVLMPIKYDEVYYNHQAQPSRIEARVGKLWGIFSPEGKALIPIEYDEIQSDGFNYKVRKADKYGVFDADGKELIPVCYQDIFDHRFTERSLVRIDKKWSVYRWLRDDQSATPCRPKTMYDGVGYFLDYFMVKNNDKFGLLDENQKVILPIEYEGLDVFHEPYLRTVIVKKGGKYGLIRIDSTLKTIAEVPIEYDDIWVEPETFKVKVKLGENIDYYYENAPYFGMEYNDVRYFENSRMFSIKKNGKWGIALENKTVIIPPKYDKITLVGKNDFMVQRNGKWGLVDSRGKFKIPAAYIAYEYLDEWGVFFVAKSETQWGIMSPRIGVVLDAKYQEIIILSNKMYLVMKNGYWGVMGINNREIAKTIYSAFEWKPGDNKIQLIDANGTKYPMKIMY